MQSRTGYVPTSWINSLVYFHQDDTARAQKTDFDVGKIYFWGRMCCLQEITLSVNLNHRNIREKIFTQAFTR